MTGQQAVRLIDRILEQGKQRKLKDLESTIVLQTWEGRTYREIADRVSYELDYIKQIAARLWKSLSGLVGEYVCKSNIRSVLERCQELIPMADWGKSIDISHGDGAETDLQTIETWMISDRMTTIAFFCSGENNQTPQSLQLTQQIQSQIESIIWQSLHQSPNLNSLLDRIFPILIGVNIQANSTNCLIVNFYS